MAGIKDRLIQFILRGKDELSPAAKASTAAMDELREKTEELGKSLDSAKDARGLVNNLVVTERAIAQAQGSIGRVEKQIADLRDALAKSPDNKGLEVSLKAAEREASNLRRGLDQLNAKHADQQKAAKSAGVDTTRLSEEEKRLAGQIDNTKDEIAAANEELRRLAKQQNDTADSASGFSSAVDAVKTGVTEAAVKFSKWLVGIYLVDKALQGLGAGLSYARDGVMAFIGSGSDNEQALQQLEASLASTGNAAGLTADQLLKMADSIRSASMLTTEQILSAETRLLSYTDIAANEFPEALQVVIDQAQRLGISVEQSAETVGKALQSPSDAMAALGRQGFKLEAGQKELMEQLEATGRKAEAQRIILNMMTEAYGGAAAAARLNTFKGLLKGIGDQLGDFAGRVADAGAFDFLKGQLQELSDEIQAMADDGRLDRLADSLSHAFEVGVKWAKDFAKQLLNVDFKELVDGATKFFNTIEEKIEETSRWVTIITTPFKVAINVLTATAAAGAAMITGIFSKTFSVIAKEAELIPESLGGPKIRSAIQGISDSLGKMSRDAYSQISQDTRDIGKAFDDLANSVEKSSKRQAKASTDAAGEALKAFKAASAEAMNNYLGSVSTFGQAMNALPFADTKERLNLLKVAITDAFNKKNIDQGQMEQLLDQIASKMRALESSTKGATAADNERAAAITALKEKQKELIDQNLKGALSLEDLQVKHNALTEEIRKLEQSTTSAAVSIKSYQEAQDALSTARSVEQLKTFQKALFDAYNNKDINLDQFQQLHNQSAVAIDKLNAAAGKAAPSVGGLATSLKSLTDVQGAISQAKTDVDIERIRKALTDMYKTGVISSSEYNREVAQLDAKQKELKQSTDALGKSTSDQSDNADKATKSMEEQRRESGRLMEEQRRAMGEAMEAHRKGTEDTKEVTEGAIDFFGDQLAAARQPLAELSDEALRLFDSLQGLSSSEVKLDTSSVESTEKALEQVRQSLADIGSLSEVGMGGFGRWAVSLRRNSLEMQQATLEQKQTLLELLDEVDRSDTNLQNFLTRATAARNSLGLLNDSDLRQLEGAIDSARQRMQQLQEGSKQTLTSLQEELAGLRGEQEALDRSKFASRKADLQKQITDAQASGDNNALQNLMQAMTTLRQIENETNRQREQAAQEKLVEERNKAAPVTEPAAAAPPTTRVIRFETPQGAKEVTVASEADETNLLGVLEQFRGRTG